MPRARKTRRRRRARVIQAELVTGGKTPPKSRRAGTDDRHEPQRRCIASGEVVASEAMVRFVVGPDGTIVPDLAGRLPGRGLWLRASRGMVNTAVARKLFARAARRPVTVPPDLAQRIEDGLAERSLNLVGLARRAGEAVVGREKVRAWLKAGKGGVLLSAADGSVPERSRMRALASGRTVIDLFGAAELGAVFGRDHAVHAIVAAGGLARRLEMECGRLAGFRAGAPDEDADVRAGNELERD